MPYKTIFKKIVLAYVRSLSDEEVDRLIASLRADEKGFDLTQMVAAYGSRAAAAQAMIHLAREEQHEKGCQISMRLYLWFKHRLVLDGPAGEKSLGDFDLDTLERAFVSDVESDAARYLTAMVWSARFIALTNARFLKP